MTSEEKLFDILQNRGNCTFWESFNDCYNCPLTGKYSYQYSDFGGTLTITCTPKGYSDAYTNLNIRYNSAKRLYLKKLIKGDL